MDNKYAGDPDSPNFLPPSPLIDRQVLSAQVERELKRCCAAALATEKSADNDLELIARYLANAPKNKPLKHDKHSSFTFQPPRPYVPDLITSSFLPSNGKLPSEDQAQQKGDRQEPTAAILFDPWEPAKKKVSWQKPTFSNIEDEALYDIRCQLDMRPKTSAAACIDYIEPPSPAYARLAPSVPSNQTRNSTALASAAITFAQASKRFSHSVPLGAATASVDAVEITALPTCSHDTDALAPEQTTQAPYLMAEQIASRQRSFNPYSHAASDTRPLRESHSSQPRLTSEPPRPPSRTGSIRSNISSSIREYIRPGSSSGTTRSDRSTSARPRVGKRFSALRARISSVSLRSQQSGRTRLGCDSGEEYFIDPKRVNLDRPLPPLPGLDSYKEKPKHIGLMMKSVFSISAPSRVTKNVVIDDDGFERAMTSDEERQRQEDLARAVMEKMSMGSIGSAPTSPTGVITVYRQGARVNTQDGSRRPVTAGSGMGVGAVPLHKACQGPGQSHPEGPGQPSLAGNQSAVGVFVKKVAGRFGWGRKTNVVSII